MNDKELDEQLNHLQEVVGNPTIRFFREALNKEYSDKKDRVMSNEYLNININLIAHFIANEIGRLAAIGDVPMRKLLNGLFSNLKAQVDTLQAQVDEVKKEMKDIVLM